MYVPVCRCYTESERRKERAKGKEKMKENKYDDIVFFQKYSEMDRSKKGLEGAGEWKTLEKMLPCFEGKRVLDLGCGYGWHCEYAAEHGAVSVTGVDISRKMLEVAGNSHGGEKIRYLCLPMEEVEFPDASFDVILSSLAFHYVKDFRELAEKADRFLAPGGEFIFSVEHPVFTSNGSQDWFYDDQGKILHFPVDHYYEEGKRKAVFLGEEVIKYHRTLTTYVNTLLDLGMELTGLQEPQPPEEMLDSVPGMREELRRPMMLLLKARKRGRADHR